MTEGPVEQPVFRDTVPDAADPGAGAPGGGREGLRDHLAEDTVGERPQDDDLDAADLGGADLADELDGRPAPRFRTPHPDAGPDRA